MNHDQWSVSNEGMKSTEKVLRCSVPGLKWQKWRGLRLTDFMFKSNFWVSPLIVDVWRVFQWDSCGISFDISSHCTRHGYCVSRWLWWSRMRLFEPRTLTRNRGEFHPDVSRLTPISSRPVPRWAMWRGFKKPWVVTSCDRDRHWLCTGQNPVWKRWNVSRCKPTSWPQTFQMTQRPMALRDEVVTYTAVLQAHLQKPTLQGEIWKKHAGILFKKVKVKNVNMKNKLQKTFQHLNNIHQWTIYFGWIQDDLNPS